MTYQEIKNKISEHSPENCFFAFSTEQFNEGRQKKGIPEDAKILSAGHGMYGTKEGLENFRKFMDDSTAEIKETCSPQDIYEHEFWNHECSYVCDDEEAILIVISYFGRERAKEVKRQFAYYTI